MRRLAVCLLVCSTILAIPRNITVDDDSSMITYSGDWEPASQHLNPLDFGGGHSVTSQDGATATFTFTGVAVYFMGPLWPYDVFSQVSLDNGPPVRISMVDRASTPTDGGSESVRSAVLWGASGLSNSRHTLVVSRADRYAIVDAFVYTVDDGQGSSSSSSTTLSSSSSISSTTSLSSIMTTVTSVVVDTGPSFTSTRTITSVVQGITSGSSLIFPISTNTSGSSNGSSSGSGTSQTVIIAVAVTVGILALVAALATFIWCCRRRRNESDAAPIWPDLHEHKPTVQAPVPGPSYSPRPEPSTRESYASNMPLTGSPSYIATPTSAYGVNPMERASYASTDFSSSGPSQYATTAGVYAADGSNRMSYASTAPSSNLDRASGSYGQPTGQQFNANPGDYSQTPAFDPNALYPINETMTEPASGPSTGVVAPQPRDMYSWNEKNIMLSPGGAAQPASSMVPQNVASSRIGNTSDWGAEHVAPNSMGVSKAPPSSFSGPHGAGPVNIGGAGGLSPSHRDLEDLRAQTASVPPPAYTEVHQA
ncbi:hypothetical protein HGRIS_012477 [Hohenbuehelia grisea]|uniref:Transmembrane protein n=1 Tax=Hohenbuehelia grisea TaxID=104357 RepID=A0ABR3ISF2_9AGAR